ncbi:hypothetical protein ACSFA8_08860 [Variovorax sp. RT4R15]|uniref:hypothetical protein n=1 Tax=Variovorax sp. RT4R15 TaxID=3443737 RepID=UPI003F45F48F
MKPKRSAFYAILTAATFHCSSTWAAGHSAPLDCPQCGTWTLTYSQPPGGIGELLVMQPERVSIPMCGEFRSTVVGSSMKDEVGRGRTYHVSLLLSGSGNGPCAGKSSDENPLRAEVDIAVAWRADGGSGSFELIDGITGETVYVASGWNYGRDNPCNTGSGKGSAACITVANAELQRQLFRSALAASADYRVGRVVRAAERACKSQGQSAGGSWPAYWQEACQWEVVEKKLQAFSIFHECRKRKGQACRLPDEKVGRPAENLQ